MHIVLQNVPQTSYRAILIFLIMEVQFTKSNKVYL